MKEKWVFTLFRQNVSLAAFTTLKIGGDAKYFWEPDAVQLPEVLKYCSQNKTPVYYLGRGSNVLIDDAGLPGLLICTRKALLNITHRKNLIIAEGGAPMPYLAKYAARLGISGYEFLVGIPGTVGAGVATNAGLSAGFQREIKDVLHSVDVVTQEGNLKSFTAEELSLRYRGSCILDNNYFVIRAYFIITQKANPADIRQQMALHLSDRHRKQPVSKFTAGSTFKKPSVGRPAGWYIDQAGLKGHRIGGAVISKKHANWIENDGTATARDVKQLVSYVQEVVFEKFSIWLEREIIYLP